VRLRRLAKWVPLGIWGYLAAGRGQWWRTSPRLPEQPAPESWPSVTVVVPARDEADMLGRTLPSLLAQDYPGDFDIVVVDDGSSDGTGQVAKTIAAVPPGPPTTVISGSPRPEGWAGKVWAMAQGVAAARGEWILFTDADIYHPASSLRRLVAHGLADQRSAVSLMARLSTETAWEQVIAPAFVYFFAQIYPFALVNRRSSRVAAAAGGCLLVRTDALAAAGGLGAIAGETIDDVALAKLLSRAGGDVWLGLADQVHSLRPYPHLSDLWDMVARNAYTQLRKRPEVLAGTVAGLGVTYLAAPALTVAGLVRRRPGPALAGASAWALMAATYLPMARYYRVPRWTAAALPATASLYLAMTLDSARRHHFGHQVKWKGRPL
jgi:hopene-associated glycosyltransferase HpnB